MKRMTNFPGRLFKFRFYFGIERNIQITLHTFLLEVSLKETCTASETAKRLRNVQYSSLTDKLRLIYKFSLTFLLQRK